MIKIKNNFTEKKRLEVLNLSKHYVKQNGWNHFLFKKISEEKKISYNELILLFENGYQDILKLSFEQINNDLEKECKNSDLIKLPVHKRIRKIILNKINLMDKDKHFFKRTFYYLLIPSNYNLLTQNLYKTVDLMWHIAGDNSTDFNFYSKRIILAGLYYIILIMIIYLKLKKY